MFREDHGFTPPGDYFVGELWCFCRSFLCKRSRDPPKGFTVLRTQFHTAIDNTSVPDGSMKEKRTKLTYTFAILQLFNKYSTKHSAKDHLLPFVPRLKSRPFLVGYDWSRSTHLDTFSWRRALSLDVQMIITQIVIENSLAGSNGLTFVNCNPFRLPKFTLPQEPLLVRALNSWYEVDQWHWIRRPIISSPAALFVWETPI